MSWQVTVKPNVATGNRQVELQRAQFFGFDKDSDGPVSPTAPDIPSQPLIDPKEFSALESLPTGSEDTQHESHVIDHESDDVRGFKITAEQYERYRKVEALRRQAQEHRVSEPSSEDERIIVEPPAEPSKVADASFSYTEPDVIQLSHTQTGLRHVKGSSKVKALDTGDSLTEDSDNVPRLKFVAKGPSEQGESIKRSVVNETRVTRKDLASQRGWNQYSEPPQPPESSTRHVENRFLRTTTQPDARHDSDTLDTADWRDRSEVDTQPIEKRVLINQWEQTLQERQREEAEASRRIQPTRKYEPPTQVSYDDQVSSVRSRFDDLSTQPQNKVRHWEVKAPSRVVLGGPGQIRTDNRKEDYPAPTQPQYESSSSESEGPEGESIVEREIRLTLKREASLRRRQRKAGGTSTSASSAPPREAPVERTPSISQSESESEEEPQAHRHEVIKSEFSDMTYTSPELSKAKPNRSNGYEDDRSYRANLKPNRREPARNEKPAEPAQFYREMTEADRGAEMKQRESIIEREIREQQEREAVLRLQRGLPPPSPPSPPAHRPSVHSESEGSYYSDSVSSRSPSPEPRDSPPPSARYDRKPARYADDRGPAPSSLIEQEILENQRREEELRAARLSATNNGNGSSRSPTAAFSPSAAYSPGPSTGSSDTQRRDSRDSLESYGASSRDSRDQLDGATRQSVVSPFDESVGYRDKPETPIEREIRIAREREAEMRQERGLPSPQPSSEGSDVSYSDDDASYSDSDVMVEVHEYSGRSRMDPDLQEEHERRLASMRLQKEMEKERRREEELQSQGAIKGTSHQYTDNPAPLPGSSSSSSRRKSGRPYKNKTPEANNNPAPAQSSAPSRGSRSSGFDSSSVRGDQAGRIPSKIQRELDEDRKREEEFRLARTSVSGGSAQTSQHF